MSDPATFGDVVREARESRCSLREFAKILGLSPSYVSDIENDRRTPAELVILLIADQLGLDFGRLMALAGRLGVDSERYMRRNPAAWQLMRDIAQAKLSEAELGQVREFVADLKSKESH